MIKPIGNNIVAEMIEEKSVTSSGIFLGDQTAKSLAPRVAKILAVGDLVTRVEKDQKIVFKPYATYEVKDDKTELVMIEEQDILGIVE